MLKRKTIVFVLSLILSLSVTMVFPFVAHTNVNAESVALSVNTDWVGGGQSYVSISNTITSQYPNAGILNSGISNTNQVANESKCVIAPFTRGQGVVITFNNPIDVSKYSSITFSLGKNIGASVTFDFYKNVADTVIGETVSGFTANVTCANFDINRAVQSFTMDLVPFAIDGYVSSFIFFHTTDARPQGDFESFQGQIMNFVLTPLEDYMLNIASGDIDMNISQVNDLAGIGYTQTVCGVSTAKNKMYANNFNEYAGVKITFTSPIQSNKYSQLLLSIKLDGWTIGVETKYTHYLDFFKDETSEISHVNAVASYNLCHSYQSALVVNLADFADKDGLVSGFIIYQFDHNRSDENANATINLHIFESQVLVNPITQMTKAKNQAKVFYAMPQNNKNNQTFVGWKVGEKLYPTSSNWDVSDANSTDIETAMPMYVGFYMQAGASVKVDEVSALRWDSLIGATDYENLNNLITMTFGTTIKSLDGSKELDILRTDSWFSNIDGNYNFLSHGFSAILENINSSDYKTEFIATGWMEIRYSNQVVMRINAVQTDNMRSVEEVATLALNDLSAEFTQPQKDVLEVLAGI